MLGLQEGSWRLLSGKHAGKSLDEVAGEDPGYLTWMWNAPKVYSRLPDNAAYALEDVMKARGIPFSKGR